jgi:CheY-like chemotaxis protein
VATRPPGATLLVVEDEAGIRSLIVKAMERQGYGVLQAGSPAEALLICEDLAAAPSAVISDLMVPGMSGRELTERLRTKWPELPVLFISGFTPDRELAERIASGSLPERTRFLQKPFTSAQLGEEVKALLDLQSR